MDLVDFLSDLSDKILDGGFALADKLEEKGNDVIDRVFEPIERLAGFDMTIPLFKGDVIFVNRGTYLHYGIYIGDHKVIHFAPRNGGEACIHKTSLDNFLNSGVCRVVEFHDNSEDYEEDYEEDDCTYNDEDRAEPVRIGNLKRPGFPVVNNHLLGILNDFTNSTDYHIYSGRETVKRAKSELNKKGYNLITNNCEHFAIWCKTGIHESNQVDNFLGLISHLVK